jgi:hypothetical protein
VSLERLLERQAGVLTLTLALAQATACGMSPDTVQRRARDRDVVAARMWQRGCGRVTGCTSTVKTA